MRKRRNGRGKKDEWKRVGRGRKGGREQQEEKRNGERRREERKGYGQIEKGRGRGEWKGEYGRIVQTPSAPSPLQFSTHINSEKAVEEDPVACKNSR